MGRILFIPEVTSLDTSERSPGVYRMLQERHEVVGLAAPWDSFLYDTRLAKWPRYLLYALDKALLALRGLRLARRRNVRVVFCETANHALPGLLIARLLGLRCVWDSHGNVGLFARAVGKGWVFTHLSSRAERFLAHRVDALLTVTAQDADAYVAMGAPRERITIIPVCVHPDSLANAGPRAPVGRQRTVPQLLFFASFRYAPNREALEFVNSELAPFLEREGVRCEIRIAGRDIPDLRFHPSVRPIGFVPDLPGAIRSADLCLVPLWRGVGMLSKVIDIMAAGTPAVLTRFAASGIAGLDEGVHAFVAPSRADFCREVLRALAEPERARSMAVRARQLVEERYDWARYRPLLQAVVEGTAGPTREVAIA